MALVKRSALSVPLELAREVIQVDALGGEVAVVELDLGARLAFEDALVATRKRGQDGDLVGDLVPQLLAVSVVGEEGVPLLDVKQWRVFGGRHPAVAVELFNAAMRLSGLDGAEHKKN